MHQKAHVAAPRKQPLEAALNRSALLTLPTVSALTGFKKTKIYGEMKKGQFPLAIRHGSRCTRWRAGDITDWLDALAI